MPRSTPLEQAGLWVSRRTRTQTQHFTDADAREEQAGWLPACPTRLRRILSANGPKKGHHLPKKKVINCLKKKSCCMASPRCIRNSHCEHMSERIHVPILSHTVSSTQIIFTWDIVLLCPNHERGWGSTVQNVLPHKHFDRRTCSLSIGRKYCIVWERQHTHTQPLFAAVS